MAEDYDGLALKVSGGLIILIYWMVIAFEVFANDKWNILPAGETAIVHWVGFLLIMVGWALESKDVENKIQDIRNDVSDNKQILDIIETYFQKQKLKKDPPPPPGFE